MFRRTSRERTRLYITNWRVSCPRRGDLELDECLSCGHLGAIDGAEQPRFIECRWRRFGPAGTGDLYTTLDRRL